MPNVKVRITSETEEQQQGGMEQIQPSKGSDTARMATTSLFVHAAVNNVKQAVQFGLSNVGNFTGDYIAQRNINQALDAMSGVSSIVMGAVTGGWAGAVIATASVAMRGITGEISRQMQYRNEDIQTSMMLQRSGNALTDGSRGTEN